MIEFIIVGLLIFFAVILAVQEYKITFIDHKTNNRRHMVVIENATYICNECGRSTRLSREYDCTNLEFAHECICEHCRSCATLNRIDTYHYEI